MKTKHLWLGIVSFLLATLSVLSFSGCYWYRMQSKEVNNTTWICEDADISFTYWKYGRATGNIKGTPVSLLFAEGGTLLVFPEGMDGRLPFGRF